MFGAAGDMTSGAGPLHTNSPTMGQASSSSSSAAAAAAQQRHHIKASSSAILREDSIVREVEDVPVPAGSSEDSRSMQYVHSNQAPYCYSPPPRQEQQQQKLPRNELDSRMMTSTSLLHVPRQNQSADLAWFLRTTGPVDSPHRRPTKLEQQPRRAVSAPKNALRFLKLGSGERRKVQRAHDRLNGVLREDPFDEGGLLPHAEPARPLPPNVEQKVSSKGQRYLALVPPAEEEERDRVEDLAGPSILSPDILESRVSIRFHEESQSVDVLDSWLSSLSKQQVDPHQDRLSTDDNDHRPAVSYEEVASRLARRCPTPVRPAASNPPTPEPHSAISMADSYQTEFQDRPVSAMSVDAVHAGPGSDAQEGAPMMPKISLPREEFPVKHPSAETEVEMRHPLPRRLGSHPVLLQRASSIASTLYPTSRSVSDSPGPPPPRSPLRLRRDPRTIEKIIKEHNNGDRKSTPKIAPSIRSASEFDFGAEPIRATVTTECTGPIKRPKSRNKDTTSSPQRRPCPMNRKEREERVRVRKLRDRPTVSRTIDSVVHAPAQATRQRLKKMRPQIQIPDLRPYPLRAPSAASQVSASGAGSWRKITPSTQTPISPVPSRASEFSEDDRAGCTPISPSASAEARAAQAGMELSPVMLVAEEVPVPRTKVTPKPARLILKDGKKTYAPRPRSASLPKPAVQRRSRQSVQGSSTHSSPRSKSPRKLEEVDHAPPLPSPPPTRALPPTPPASGSEKQSKANSKAKLVVGSGRELETLHSHDVSPVEPSSKHPEKFTHVATQRRNTGFKATNRAASRIDARLEALEKQNALLSAALMAVLKTNGAFNSPVPDLDELESPSKGPMAWESRVARRSAATSHTASSSNGSALEMYMSTRRGSRHGA
ncbi:Hypothetical predicted protein [Lecanosticta acicola]|uniref:Uncharacterized protein n=1 Tax=Lecanosticta acicola TaxID=111012 RepID=A0AAI8YUV7_9PEZI|nr:Hypothetical predicted protein [Lecanosticta acicola]